MILLLQWITTLEWTEHLSALLLACLLLTHVSLRRAYRNQLRQHKHVCQVAEQERLIYQQQQETQQWLLASYQDLLADREEQIRYLSHQLEGLTHLSNN